MPVSKRRKSSTKKRTPATVTPEPKSTRWALKLNPSSLAFIKNDPDFLTMIKIGRALNALAFAGTCMLDYQGQESIVKIRQTRRANFILSGYLHEAIKVVLAVKGRYLGDPSFEPLRLLVLDKKYDKARYYVRKVRNCAAFHLDEHDDTTRRTLAKIKPTAIRFACGDDFTYFGVYYELADTLDYTFLKDELYEGGSLHETIEDLHKTVHEFAIEFMDAANTFQEALASRFELSKYVY